MLKAWYCETWHHTHCEEGHLSAARARSSVFKKQAIKKSVEVLSYYSLSVPKGFCSHTNFVKDMTTTPGDRETPGLCTHYYAALHGFTVSNYTDGVYPRESNTFFKKTKLKKKKYIYLPFFKLFTYIYN